MSPRLRPTKFRVSHVPLPDGDCILIPEVDLDDKALIAAYSRRWLADGRDLLANLSYKKRVDALWSPELQAVTAGLPWIGHLCMAGVARKLKRKWSPPDVERDDLAAAKKAVQAALAIVLALPAYIWRHPINSVFAMFITYYDTRLLEAIAKHLTKSARKVQVPLATVIETAAIERTGHRPVLHRMTPEERREAGEKALVRLKREIRKREPATYRGIVLNCAKHHGRTTRIFPGHLVEGLRRLWVPGTDEWLDEVLVGF